MRVYVVYEGYYCNHCGVVQYTRAVYSSREDAERYADNYNYQVEEVEVR